MHINPRQYKEKEPSIAIALHNIYVVTKFILSTASDINFSKFNFKDNCEYLGKRGKGHNLRIEKHISDLIDYCTKIQPYIHFYKQQIESLNDTAHHILGNEIDIVLPKFPEIRQEKRGIFATLISGFIGLTYGGIPSFLHNRRHKALHKAANVINRQTTTQCNKLVHLENPMKTLENLINTVHSMHNSTTEIERLFAGELNAAYTWYINTPNTQEYAINSLLYLRTIRDKYIQMNKEFIKQLCIYTKAVRILANGYLPISLITLLKLKEILNMVRTTVRKTNPHYDLVKKDYIYIMI